MKVFVRTKAPSIHQCYKLLKQYNVPHHIVQHSETVCNVARFLADQLNKRGENLSIAEIEAAALLHDMTKMEGLKTREDHAKTGKKLLANLSFKRIGEIVAEHIRLRKGRNPQILCEEEIINYSDKRVMHTGVVTLAERFADLRNRYGVMEENLMERIVALEHESYELENKIFCGLDLTPEELLDSIKRALKKARKGHERYREEWPSKP